MNISFVDLISTLNKIETCNESLYSLLELCNKLEKVDSISIDMNDHISIVPFYMSDEGRYEIYWGELTIKSVSRPMFENYILERTGKKKIEAVDETVKERMKSLYLEVVTPKTSITSSELINCIRYIINSTEVIEDVTKAFVRHKPSFVFAEEHLYFAVY